MKQYLFIFFLLAFAFGCRNDSTENKAPQPPDISKLKVGAQIGGFITPDKAQLSFKKTGTGNQVLVVPNSAYLADQLKPLEAYFTIIYYDMRNRGRSQTVGNINLMVNGVLNDVRDLETLRKHFKLEKINLLGHDYLGLVAMLYAKDHPQHVNKVVQIGTVPPLASKDYSADQYKDSLNRVIPQRIAALEAQKADYSPKEFCVQWWKNERLMHLGNTILATQLPTRICNYRNEQPEYLWPYIKDYIQPSIEKLNLTDLDISAIQTEVLTIHGTKDRIAPMGGAKDWENLLPNGKLMQVEGAGHFPWLEEPQKVFNAINDFING